MSVFKFLKQKGEQALAEELPSLQEDIEEPDELPDDEKNKLEDYFMRLTTEQIVYKLWFKFI